MIYTFSYPYDLFYLFVFHEKRIMACIRKKRLARDFSSAVFLRMNINLIMNVGIALQTSKNYQAFRACYNWDEVADVWFINSIWN